MKIFIGGSGRSGTTLLQQILGCHQDVYSIPNESRFIIDPDGLVNAADALTLNYSPFQAREALYRLERLLTVHLCTPGRRPYLRFNYDTLFGRPFYRQQVQELMDQLVSYRFSGSSYFEYMEGRERGEDFFRPILGAGYFAQRSDVTAPMARFIDQLFTHLATKQGRSSWSEKTPFNILHIEFLWELFPQAVIFHIKRDPRAVIASMLRPGEYWAPDNAHDAALFLKSIYERWTHIKETVDFTNRRFLELTYEDLVAEPEPILEQIAQTCGLENRFWDLPLMKTSRVDGWQDELTPSAVKQINNVLGPLAQKLGYPK